MEVPALNLSKYVAPDKISEGMKTKDWEVKYRAVGPEGVHPDVVGAARKMVEGNEYLTQHVTAGELILQQMNQCS